MQKKNENNTLIPEEIHSTDQNAVAARLAAYRDAIAAAEKVRRT